MENKENQTQTVLHDIKEQMERMNELLESISQKKPSAPPPVPVIKDKKQWPLLDITKLSKITKLDDIKEYGFKYDDTVRT